jgi:hypothetical protein
MMDVFVKKSDGRGAGIDNLLYTLWTRNFRVMGQRGKGRYHSSLLSTNAHLNNPTHS